MKFKLLGSGAVRPDLERWGPCQTLEVNGETLVFDCGRGASMRLTEAGICLSSIKRLFFTHHHYDHNCDFAYLFLTGWVLGRDFPMEIVGPRGTEAFCRGTLEELYREDIATRKAHVHYNQTGCTYSVRDVTDDEWNFAQNGWSISAIHVPHAPAVLDNLAYRVQHEGKTVVIVGDSMPCEQLMQFAAGADLLVHECTFPHDYMVAREWDSFHTSPKELGRWAKTMGVKKLLLKHFAVQEGVTVEDMVAEVASEFGRDGLITGADLMDVEV